MRKKTVSIIAVMLIVSLMSPMCAFATKAQEEGSVQIAETGVSLSWSNKTKYRMGLYFEITACEDMEIIGASKVEFYYFYNKEWHLEKTVTVEECPELQTTNDFFTSVLIERDARYSNVPYRAIVYFYCLGPYGTSTVEHYSNTITAATEQVIDP